MKKHLLIFCLATLLMAALNDRNNTIPVVSADFPAMEQVTLSQKDDSRSIGTTRRANSLFLSSTVNNTVSGENNQPTAHLRLSETAAFVSQITERRVPTPVSPVSFIIAYNGAFHRAADYYVYTLRHIIV